jgi:dienelactone hydrolase
MNTITTRSIAALAATGALVAGGTAAANATGGDDSHRSGDESQRTEVEQLVHDAIKDGVVTVEEETAIKQAIEDHSELEFESLEDAVPQG